MHTRVCVRGRVYPKVSGLAAWSENCKWYSTLPLKCNCIAILCQSITLCVAFQRVFVVVVVYFVIDSVRKLFDIPSYVRTYVCMYVCMYVYIRVCVVSCMCVCFRVHMHSLHTSMYDYWLLVYLTTLFQL
jgi:hypothetical protein